MIQYEAEFCASIGGYSRGAYLMSRVHRHYWVSLVDHNMRDPDIDSEEWGFVLGFPPAAIASFNGDL